MTGGNTVIRFCVSLFSILDSALFYIFRKNFRKVSQRENKYYTTKYKIYIIGKKPPDNHYNANKGQGNKKIKYCSGQYLNPTCAARKDK
jgi:hypothetical protein